jgi:hypothetical protein
VVPSPIGDDGLVNEMLDALKEEKKKAAEEHSMRLSRIFQLRSREEDHKKNKRTKVGTACALNTDTTSETGTTSETVATTSDTVSGAFSGDLTRAESVHEAQHWYNDPSLFADMSQIEKGK